METLLFFHGGPGLNSNPENQLLKNPYREKGIDLICWNEPSKLRGTIDETVTRQQQLLNSAEQFFLSCYNGKPISVMSHSMGSQTVFWLIKRHPDKVKAIILIAPCFDIFTTDKQIFKLIEKDFQQNADEMRSENLRNIIAQFEEDIYANVINGWKIVLENPRLFDYYWMDKDKRDLYLSFFQDPFFKLDLEGFFAIRKTYKNILPCMTDHKTIIFNGKKDLITPAISKENDILKNFTMMKIFSVQKAMHYPHIEEMDKVLNIIRNMLKEEF